LIRIKYGQWVIDRKVNDKENLKKLWAIYIKKWTGQAS
jgi:hypothetical protein